MKRFNLTWVSLMFAFTAVILAASFLILTTGFSRNLDNSSVKFISVLVRHGDRTPMSAYPNDPWKNYPWPGGWGALTKAGKNQLFKVGKRLMSTYGGLLNESYSPDDIRVQSSDADRCHMSIASALAAMYPPKGSDIWNPDLLWQPIPIHSLPRLLDATLAMKKTCAKYDEELKKAYDSPEIQKINQENAEVYKYLSEHTGVNVTTVSHVEEIHTTLEIEQLYGLKLPDWAHEVFPEKTYPLMKQCLAIFSFSDFMKRIRGGSFLKEVIENMISKRDGTLKPNRSMFLYSGHDLTVMTIFQTLGFKELFKVQYGDVLIFELHETGGNDMELQLKYYNSTEQVKPHVLDIPGCTAPCLLDAFVKQITPMLPEDFEQECQN